MRELLCRSLLLLGVVVLPLANCSCDQSMTVVDTFGDGDVEGDRLHQYAVGGRAAFTLSGTAIVPEAVVSSSDENVFRVVSVVPRTISALLQPTETVFDVVIEGVAAGTAALSVSNNGEVVDERSLTFVNVSGALFTRVVGFPGDVEGPVTTFVVGERISDFLVRYVAGDDDDVHGLDVLATDNTLVSLDVQTIRGDFVRTERNILRIAGIDEVVSVPFTLAGVAVAEPLIVEPGVPSSADYVRKNELRALLADRDVPAALADMLASGTDERVICDGNTCAAKIEPKDAAGRPIFGAAVNWQVPGLEGVQPGDIFVFQRGSNEYTVQPAVDLPDGQQIVVDSLTVNAAPESLTTVNSTTAVSCAAFGEGGASLFAVVALLLRRRRTAEDR